MKINWKVRISNKAFWVSLISTAILLIQAVAKLFGYELHLEGISEQLIEIINIIFVLLAVLGVVVDPTTKGVGDSARALTYTKVNK